MELTFAPPKRRLLPATPAPGPPSSGSAEAGRSSCHGIASASECRGRFWRSESSVGRKLDRVIFHSGFFFYRVTGITRMIMLFVAFLKHLSSLSLSIWLLIWRQQHLILRHLAPKTFYLVAFSIATVRQTTMTRLK